MFGSNKFLSRRVSLSKAASTQPIQSENPGVLEAELQLTQDPSKPAERGYSLVLKVVAKKTISAAVLSGFVANTLLTPLLPIFTSIATAGTLQNPSLSPAFVDKLKATRLGTNDYRRLVCAFYVGAYLDNLPGSSLCNFFSNLPNFYSNATVSYYKINNCDGSNSIIIGNLLFASGDPTFNMSGRPRPDQQAGLPITASVTVCSNTADPGFKTANGSNIDPSQNSVKSYSVIPYQTLAAADSISSSEHPYQPNGRMSFVIVRTGSSTEDDLPADLTYQLTGTAAQGVDYNINSTGQAGAPGGNFHFSANNPTEPYHFDAIADTVPHPDQNVHIRLNVPAGYQTFSGEVDSTIIALDEPQINVSLAAGGSTVLTEGTNPGVRFSRVGGSAASLAKPMTITYSAGGTASNGADYQYLPGTATIPAGQGFVDVPIVIPVRSGTQATPDKDILIVVQPGTGYYGSTDNNEDFLYPAYTPASTTVSVTPPASATRGSSSDFTVTRSANNGDYSQAVAVVLSTTGTATSGSDYDPVPASITIPAGQQSVVVPVNFKAPSAAQPAEDFGLQVQPAQGYTASSTNGTGSVTLPAYTVSDVSITNTSGGTLNRPGSSSITITRTGDTSQPLSVALTTGGTATSGSDYAPIPPTATIPAGQTSVTVPMSATTPTADQPAEDLQVQVAPGAGYAPNSTAGTTTFNLPPFQQPRVTIAPTTGTTLNRGSNGSFTITRTGDTSQPLTVPLTTSGTATSPEDYTALPATVTIPAGSTTATVPVTTASPTTPQPAETLSATIGAGTGYTPGTASTATYNLPAYTNPALSVTPSNGGTATPGAATNKFTVSRPAGNTTQPLTVNYTLGGAATPGTDYTVAGGTGTTGTITIPAGATSADLPITVPAQSGSTDKPAKDITFTVNPGTGYDAAASQPGTLTIPAYTAPKPTLSATPSGNGVAQPGSSNSFTVSRPANSDTTQPLTVNYSIAGTATPGTDFTPAATTGTVTIPAGQTSGSVPIAVPTQSGAAQPAKTIDFKIQPGTGYTPPSGTQPDATLTIPAYTPGAVSVTPSNGGTATPGGTTNGFSVNRPAGADTTQPLTVGYSLGGTATPGTDYTSPSGGNTGTVTIPAGATSAELPITVPAQSGAAQPAKDIVVTVTPGTGYTADNQPDATLTIPAYSPTPTVIQAPTQTPTVSVTPTTSRDTTLNPGDTKTFTITRTGDTSQPLPVNLTTGGTATPGTDVDSIPPTATIPAGQTSVTVPVHAPTTLDAASNGKTFTVGIGSGTGYTPGASTTYTIAVPTRTNTPQKSSLVPSLSPNAANPGFIISTPDGKPVAKSVTVNYTISGTAGTGEREVRSGTVTLPAGEAQTSIPIRLTADAIKGHTVTASFSDPSGETTFSPNQLTYTIAQNGSNIGQGNNPELPTVGVNTAGATGNNRDLVFTVTRNGASKTNPLRVDYEVLGTAIAGVDYETLPGNINIPAGQDSAQIHVKLLKSPSEMGGRTIAIRVKGRQGNGGVSQSSSAYRVGSNGDATAHLGSASTTGTVSSSTNNDGGGSNGSGGALPAIAGAGAVLGGIAAFGGGLGSGLVALDGGACPAGGGMPPELSTAFGNSRWSPKWSEVSFSSAPRVHDMLASQYFTLDAIDGIEHLTLEQLQKLTGVDLSSRTLASILPAHSDTTIRGLASTVYSQAATIGDVPGLVEFLMSQPQLAAGANGAGLSQEAIAQMPFSTLLSRLPNLASLNLGSLPLSQVPGMLTSVTIGNLPAWQQMKINQIQGLDRVPFSQLYPCLVEHTRPDSNQPSTGGNSSDSGSSGQ